MKKSRLWANDAEECLIDDKLCSDFYDPAPELETRVKMMRQLGHVVNFNNPIDTRST